MGKNMKNDKKARNDEAVREIRAKQSQKRRTQKRIEKIRDHRKRKQQEMLQQKESEKQNKADEQNTSGIKTKQQEREGFVTSLRKVECYAQRVAAECAERKRKETYLKYVNYEPKLEQDAYYSKQTEGKGER